MEELHNGGEPKRSKADEIYESIIAEFSDLSHRAPKEQSDAAVDAVLQSLRGEASAEPAAEAPAPEAPAPEAPAPEASAPEAPAPEVPAPEAPAPEAPAPEAPAPEVPVPEAPAPEVPAPEAPAPEAPTVVIPTEELQSLSDSEKVLEKVHENERKTAPADLSVLHQPEDDLSIMRTRTMQIKLSDEVLDRPVFDEENSRWSDTTAEPPLKHDKDHKPRKKRRSGGGALSCFGWIFRMMLVVMLIVVLSVGCMGAVYAMGDILGLRADDSNITVSIEPDTSIADVAKVLKEHDVIEYPQVFRAYIRYRRDNQVNFNFGTFVLKPSMSYDELIAELEQTTESNEQVTLTFPEGYNVVQMAEKLQEHSVCTKAEFLDAINNHTYDYEFLESCYANKEGKAYVLEGYLFPDTYIFLENQNVDDVVCTFLNNFDRKFTQVMRNRCHNAGRTIDEVVILASIIESEAPNKQQMENVSSVLQNRLKNSGTFPMLQCDPTTKYAESVLLEEGFDQEVANSYDTYQCSGLPQGAINNPGIVAIEASLFPSETDYYYYCSNLETGEFFYAATLDQHENNLRLAGLA